MVPVNRNQLHANNSDYCCCCCCCCYSNDQTHHHQQQQQNEIISANDSYCSCCSCESSIEEAPFSYVAPIEPKTPDDKVLKKKHHAIEELLQTERDYVQDLSHLVEVSLHSFPPLLFYKNKKIIYICIFPLFIYSVKVIHVFFSTYKRNTFLPPPSLLKLHQNVFSFLFSNLFRFQFPFKTFVGVS